MLEKYLKAGKDGCVKRSQQILRRASFLPAGAWVAILAISLAGAIHFRNVSPRPAHLNEIAAECGDFGAFWGPSMVDHKGNHVAYTQTTVKGVGIFLYETSTGKSKLIKEFPEGPLQPPHMEILLPWSPDDASFAYLNHAGRCIVICNIITGATEQVPCNNPLSFVWPPAAAWLTSDSFVYVNERQQFHLVHKQADGQWQDTVRAIPSQVITPRSLITAISSNNIAWLCENALWTMDVRAAGAPVKIFAAPANNPALTAIKAMSYSDDTTQFLLDCRARRGDSLWRLSPGQLSTDNPSQVKTAGSINDASWIKGGNGYAYTSQNGKDNTLVVQPDSSAEPVNLFSIAKVKTFAASANGKRLFIQGVASNEFTPSLWQYDVDSSSLQGAAPPAEQPLKFVRSIAQFNDNVDLSSGRRIRFGLFLPPNYDRHKSRRYPVIFAPPYLSSYCPAFANCGAVCIYVDRDSMSDEAVEKWKGDVLEVYKFITKNPMVAPILDTHRFFIGGACAETIGLTEFVSTNASLWKGVILLSPIKFPDPPTLASGGHAPGILISTGSGYGGADRDQWIRQYQVDAAKAGVRVYVSIYGGNTHDLIARSSMRERMQSIMDFIFEN